MAVNFDKFFKLTEERGIGYSQILRDAKISGNILTRMRRNEYVSLESIEKICRALECEITDIFDFVDENTEKKLKP